MATLRMGHRRPSGTNAAGKRSDYAIGNFPQAVRHGRGDKGGSPSVLALAPLATRAALAIPSDSPVTILGSRPREEGALTFTRDRSMPTRPEQDDEQTEDQVQASTPQLDHLESLAKAAATTVQRRRWSTHRDGVQVQEDPSEVRNLTHDAEARAQAEAAMRLMGAAKPKGKPRGRW